MKSMQKFSLAMFFLAFVSFVWTFYELNRGAGHEPQFEVPGTFRSSADQPGRYYVWDNHLTMFEGTKIQRDEKFPEELEIIIRDAAGNPVEFVADTSKSWRIGNHDKSSVGYIDAKVPGEFEIEVRGDAETRILSFSQPDLFKELRSALMGFAVAAVFALVGAIAMLLSIFRRARRPAPTATD